MAISLDQLPRDPAGLVRRIVDLDAEVERLNGLVAAFRTLLFGPRSERHPPADQLTLGLDVPDPTDPVRPDVPQAAPSKPPRHGREARRNIGALPAHLPREEAVIEPVATACPCCGGVLHRIGEDVRENLGVRPVAFFVRRRVFPKYACRACEGAVVQAAAPPRAIEGGLAGDDLLVHVAVAKFSWHLPLHRQTQMMAAQGLHLDRSTLALWMKRLAWWLEPLYRRQLQATHAQARVFCDETPLPVLEPGRNRTRRGQIWAHAMDDRAWAGPAPPAVIYVFADSRSAGALAAQIPSFDGILQVDGYAAYKINTAKLNQVDPAVYLGDVLTRMVGGATPINRIAELLVWNWKAARASPTPAAA